jgi:signal transduction histidine kinase
MSIRLKLACWYGGVLAVIMAIFSATFYFWMHHSIHNQYRSSLQEQAELVFDRLEYLVRMSPGWLNIDVRLDDQDFYFTENIYLQLYNIKRDTTTLSSKSSKDRVILPLYKSTLEHLLKVSEYTYTTAVINGYPYLIYNRGIYDIQNQLIGVLQAATYAGHMYSLLEQLRFVLAVASITIILLSASFGWFLAGKALRPIGSVIEAANKIESGADLSRRISYDGPLDEIGRLIQTINGMLERIQQVYSNMEEAYRNQRRFVSDASHELRTPLTTIRGNVELMRKMWQKDDPDRSGQLSAEVVEMSNEALEDILAESERMSRLVNDLLSLARADAGQVIDKQPVDMLPIVEEVVRRAHFLRRNEQVEWRAEDLSVLKGAIVYGSRDYLQQLLFIFIENAFKYTASGEVVLSARRTDEQVGIAVRDTGIGLDKDEVPHIFERFYRADPSRGVVGGTGLGLSIARWILDEHGGSVEVFTRKGKGSTFVIWLPLWFGDRDGTEAAIEPERDILRLEAAPEHAPKQADEGAGERSPETDGQDNLHEKE